MDQLKQTEASLRLLKQFRLIENILDQLNKIEAHNFFEKTQFLKITKTHFRNTSKH